MGVNGFWSYFSSLVKEVNLDIMKNKIIFIDIVLYIHKYVIGIRKTGNNIISPDGKDLSHIFAIKKILYQFISKNIIPICVFDGNTISEKAHTISKRRNIIIDAIQNCNTIKKSNKNLNTDNNSEYIKHFKKTIYMNDKIVEECKTFLSELGLPYVVSPTEADPQCVVLANKYRNVCGGIYSEDSDIMMYGSNIILREINISKNTIKIITLQSIINFLQEKSDKVRHKYQLPIIQITPEIFYNFCLILGNDYCNGIRCNGGNNRDTLFDIFNFSNYDLQIFVSRLIEINNINPEKITYFIPENYIEKAYNTLRIYQNLMIMNYNNLNLVLTSIKFNIDYFCNKYSFNHSAFCDIYCSLISTYNSFIQNLKH